MKHDELGRYGESLAQNHLRAAGYQIRETNFRFRHLEIDLICMHENQLVIVEVKTRQTSEIGEPYKAVTRTKQRQLIKAANHYIQQHDIDLDTRFDIISIVHNSYRTEITHLENAFTTVG